MKRESEICGIRMIENGKRAGGAGPEFLSWEATKPVRRLHESLPGYAVTPLCDLKGLAARLGVKAVLVKDESSRFGLKAFKGLGGAWAVFCLACERLGLDCKTASLSDVLSEKNRAALDQMVFATTTDGNHGKGVSWAAGLLGCRSFVFMPKGSVKARAEAIEAAGSAKVTVTEFGYDDCVRYTAAMAKKNGWELVQDTSWPGYEKVPASIIEGYTTMVYEARDQLLSLGYERPTHAFIQAGVGAMTGSVLGTLACIYGDSIPLTSIVESTEAACIYESARHDDGLPHRANGSEVTMMAGLNCSEACTLTWPVLRDLASFYFACPDSVSARGMRLLASGNGGDTPVVSGESGAVPAGLLAELMEKEELSAFKERLGLGPDSVVLLFNTEGDTDPDNYRAIVGRTADEVRGGARRQQ